MAIRLLWVFPFTYLPRLLMPAAKRTRRRRGARP